MTQKETVRLNKFIASAGICSRRAADALIAEGKVKINGTLVESAGTQVDPKNDKVEVSGKLVKNNTAEEHLYIMLNKPVRVVTTAKDPQGRKTVLDMLPNAIVRKRVFPVGRLDFLSQGLLLLTTDGELCNRLTHPKWHLPKVYEVTVNKTPSDEVLKTFKNGMTFENGEEVAPVKIKIVKSSQTESIVEMELIQGLNRQIRRMFEAFNIKVLKLSRIKQGNLRIRSLPYGRHRKLSENEVKDLKKSVGL